VAGSFIYWVEGTAATIGRCKLDGTESNTEWLKEIGGEPHGIAVDANYVYWSSKSKACIGRVKHDGTGLEKEWLTGLGTELRALAVDGTYIYWTRSAIAVGRAKLNGTEVEKAWFTTENANGVSVNGTYIFRGGAGASGGVYRALLDKSGDTHLLEEVGPVGVTVKGTKVYWTSFAAGRIGRANLDGTGVEKEFIKGAASPREVAVGPIYIYWISEGVIGRCKLDGTEVEKEWFKPPTNGFALALLLEEGEEEAGVMKPNAASATAGSGEGTNVANHVVEVGEVASAAASMPNVELVGGAMPSPTEQTRAGLPLPFPSVLANPGRLGPPRFSSADRKTLGIER
jgi:hypothetical protein